MDKSHPTILTAQYHWDCFKDWQICEFLWSSKLEKIQRGLLYNSYENGGLKWLNLEALCFPLKVPFVQKLFLNEDWYSCRILESLHPLFQKRLHPFLEIQQVPIYCVDNLIENVFMFSKEAIKCWLNFQFHPPESLKDILQQIIWLHSNILTEGKPIYWKNVFDHGVWFINDIVGKNGKLMKHMVWFVHSYNQLIAALRGDWKQKINGGMMKLLVCQPAIKNMRWLLGNKINREVHKYYLTSRSLCLIPYCSHKKCEDIFDCPVPWRQVFKLIYKTTTDATTRFFQLKILYNFLPTRKMLKIWGIAESDECRVCFMESASTQF